MIHNLNKEEQVQYLLLDEIPPGTIRRFWLHLVTNGMGVPIHIPIIVAKGKKAGKVLGLTAALHGNELNGIPVIQRLFKEIKVEELSGTLVGVLVANVPSMLRRQRRFIDGTDLNHIMPGDKDGNASNVYAHRLVQRLVRKFDYFVDLHTASFGRVNSYYIRADLDDPVTRRMAVLQNAQIVVHKPASDGTLRGAAHSLNIPSITLEVGNPNTFQKGLIRDGLTGIHNLLSFLEITREEIEEAEEPPVICSHSYWMYSDEGGLLQVLPNVTDWVEKGQTVARLRNIFGDLIKEYIAPEDGIVIGKEVNPINQTGGRIIHLGIPFEKA